MSVRVEVRQGGRLVLQERHDHRGRPGVVSSRPFHMWWPTPGMYWVRGIAGSSSSTVVSHCRTCAEHSAVISIAGTRECRSCAAMDGESLIDCWTCRLAAALNEKFCVVSSGRDAIRVLRAVAGRGVAAEVGRERVHAFGLPDQAGAGCQEPEAHQSERDGVPGGPRSGHGVQSFNPSGAVGTGDPIRPLLDAIDRALATSELVGDPTSTALSLWVTLHGVVTLEIAGALDAATADTTFESAIWAALRGWTTSDETSAITRRAPRRTAGSAS
jgi:hypothetical protein